MVTKIDTLVQGIHDTVIVQMSTNTIIPASVTNDSINPVVTKLLNDYQIAISKLPTNTFCDYIFPILSIVVPFVALIWEICASRRERNDLLKKKIERENILDIQIWLQTDKGNKVNAYKSTLSTLQIIRSIVINSQNNNKFSERQIEQLNNLNNDITNTFNKNQLYFCPNQKEAIQGVVGSLVNIQQTNNEKIRNQLFGFIRQFSLGFQNIDEN